MHCLVEQSLTVALRGNSFIAKCVPILTDFLDLKHNLSQRLAKTLLFFD